jgi:hypothetical protein
MKYLQFAIGGITALVLLSALALGLSLVLRQGQVAAETHRGASPDATAIYVNGSAVDASRLPGRVNPGRYWYDRANGAFGMEGGPTLGFVAAGLDLPGPLHADASGGGHGALTGVFINGRELHPQDVAGLIAVLGGVMPGRYWVDAQGGFGNEGGPWLGNLRALAQQRGGDGRISEHRASTCLPGDTSCQQRKSRVGNGSFSDGASGCIVMDGEITC